MASAVAITTAGPAAAAEAVPSPAPYTTPGTLGHWAEAQFSQVVTDCMPASSGRLQLQEFRDGKFRGGAKTISAVPSVVASGLKFPAAASTPLLPFGASKVTGVFGYIYSGPEKTAPKFVDSHFLDIDYSGDQDQIVTPRAGFTTYTSDCTGILASALEANVDFAFPVASVRSMFSGDIDAKRRGRANVVAGTFVSPIVSMWNGKGLPSTMKASGAKFYTAVLFWDFYNTNYQHLTDNWLLAQADGASFYRFLSASNDLTSEASIDGDLSVPFLTTKASARVAYERSWKAEVQDVGFVIYNTLGPSNFMAMPTVGEVLGVASSYRGVRVGYPEGQIVQPGAPLKFHEDVDYLPASYCDDGAWTATPVSSLGGTASLSIEKAEMTSIDGQKRACRFDIVYNPGEFSDSNVVSLAFSLVRLNLNKPALVPALIVPVETASFTHSQHPALTARIGNVRTWTYAPVQKTLSWTLRFDLDDLGRIKTADAIRPRLGLTCGDAAAPTINVDRAFEGSPAPSAPNKVVRFTVTADYLGPPPAAGDPTMTCDVFGLVWYDGVESPRKFPVGIKIDLPLPPKPAPKPAQVAAESDTIQPQTPGAQ